MIKYRFSVYLLINLLFIYLYLINGRVRKIIRLNYRKSRTARIGPRQNVIFFYFNLLYVMLRFSFLHASLYYGTTGYKTNFKESESAPPYNYSKISVSDTA